MNAAIHQNSLLWSQKKPFVQLQLSVKVWISHGIWVKKREKVLHVYNLSMKKAEFQEAQKFVLTNHPAIQMWIGNLSIQMNLNSFVY